MVNALRARRLGLIPDRRFTLDPDTGRKGLATAQAFFPICSSRFRSAASACCIRGLCPLHTLPQSVEVKIELCLEGLLVLKRLCGLLGLEFRGRLGQGFKCLPQLPDRRQRRMSAATVGCFCAHASTLRPFSTSFFISANRLSAWAISLIRWSFTRVFGKWLAAWRSTASGVNPCCRAMQRFEPVAARGISDWGPWNTLDFYAGCEGGDS